MFKLIPTSSENRSDPQCLQGTILIPKHLIGFTELLAYTKYFSRCYEDKNESDIGHPLTRFVSLKGAETHTQSSNM